MSRRSADSTILGYFYQFDHTILEILRSADTQTVHVERLEDIDVEDPDSVVAIQCKYLPSKKYVPSTIREAVIDMLDDYLIRCQQDRPVTYRLFSHCDGPPDRVAQLDLDGLKRLLCFENHGARVVHYVERGITDDQLSGFLRQFQLIPGPVFPDQHAEVLESLRKLFECSREVAELLYYSNALRVVVELSSSADVNRRATTKRQFINLINTEEPICSAWYLRLKGSKAYARLMKSRIRGLDLLNPQKERLIYIGKRCMSAYQNEVVVADFIGALVHEHYELNRSLWNTKPITVVVDGDKQTVDRIKSLLIGSGIDLNDGYETLGFSPRAFRRPPVINRTGNRRAGQRISLASYRVRLLRAETYQAHRTEIQAPDSAFVLGHDDPRKLFDSQRTHVVPITLLELSVASSILGGASH
ncbi:MAG TPA: hypothetical protein VGN26_03580 [Armatimonadota bacterium]